MKLLTKEIIKKLPKLGATEKVHPKDIKVLVKFFTPDSEWSWYITEFDGVDELYGLCVGFVPELGSVSLSELGSVRGPMGLKIERDLYYEGTLEEAMKENNYKH